MIYEYYLGLGSNLGDKKYYLDGAVEALQNNSEITIQKISSYYETEPYGVKEQPEFLNAVVKIQSSLEPQELLKTVNKIENDFKRVRDKKWGPRTLDIDILLCDNYEIDEPHLKIPHPYLEERLFVLVPLQEIAPHLVLPSGRSITAVVESL